MRERPCASVTSPSATTVRRFRLPVTRRAVSRMSWYSTVTNFPGGASAVKRSSSTTVCLPCAPPSSPASITMRIEPPFSGSLNFTSNPPFSLNRAAKGSVSKEDWEKARPAARSPSRTRPIRRIT